MKVLSLFDGISCARVALDRAGIPVEAYYASEIDKYAISISQNNYPDIVQLGSVVDFHPTPIITGNIDLIIGGSPCQDLSIAKANRKGLDGERSGLFWEYVRILNEVKPKYFILENVASMSKESSDIISKELGVQPIEINASIFSAQDRKRLFWVGKRGGSIEHVHGKYFQVDIEIPKVPCFTMLGDILESDVDEKYYYHDKSFQITDLTKRVIGTIDVAGHDILKRIYNRLMKSPTVTTCAGGNTQHKVFDNNRVRKLTPREYEALQSLPKDYTAGVSDSQRYKALGNAFNVDVVAHIIKHLI